MFGAERAPGRVSWPCPFGFAHAPYPVSRQVFFGLYSYTGSRFARWALCAPPRRAFTAPRATRAAAGGVGATQESLSGATLAGGAQSRVEGRCKTAPGQRSLVSSLETGYKLSQTRNPREAPPRTQGLLRKSPPRRAAPPTVAPPRRRAGAPARRRAGPRPAPRRAPRHSSSFRFAALLLRALPQRCQAVRRARARARARPAPAARAQRHIPHSRRPRP